jgi:hypothetical protein
MIVGAGKKRQIFRFCYNTLVQKRILLLLVGAFFFSLFCFSAENQSIQDFILRLKQCLESRDFESYLKAFSPELQEGQREALSIYFDNLKMETVTLHWANKGTLKQEEPEVFLQVIYQNSYSALIETWQLTLENSGGEWKIKEKKVKGNISQLYKIKIPSERMERVESIEIRHVDISLTFKNALLFYDNIPDLETALLVMGEGHLSYSPSDPSEKHQLELIYKNKTLDDTVEYAFLRFSKSFFEKNIKITRKPKAPGDVTNNVKRARAYSLFMKYYLDYFTIQSSLSQDPLSFLPQADEAAIEFRGKKVGELAYVYSPFAGEEVTVYERSRGRYINLYSPASEKEKRRMVITFGQKYDVQNYQIELDFEPQNTYLSAKAKIEILAQVDGLDAVKLKFNPSLQILRIYDEEKRDLFFTQDKLGKILYIYFLEPIPRNKASSVEIFYRGKLEPPIQLTDTLTSAQYSEMVVFIPPRYETYLFSQSAYWYPSPPDEDYFTARLKIIVPPDYSSVSNGLILEKGTMNGIQQVTEIDKMGSSFSVFETKNPVKYLSFLVGKLTLIQEKANSFPLSTYISSDVRGLKKNFLEETQSILDFYESRFGPFPFESLRIIQRLWPTAGGHSPASFIVLNELPRSPDGSLSGVLVPSSSSPVDLSQWREYFLAHEVAHQWWGQGVTGARYRDQWLSEGLAQYSAVLYLQSKHDGGTLSSILKKFSKWTEKKAEWGPITLGSRLSFVDFEAYQAIVYNKASLVLNMLHDLLGADLFFAGLREFFNRHKYSAATTGQFKKVMEEISGRDLDDFFALWFDSHVLPEVRVTYMIHKEEVRDILRVKVDQVNDVFVFPLWLEWEEENGRALHREKMIIERKTQEFEIPLSGRAKKIRLNPDRAVPGNLILAKGFKSNFTG